jgi:hypothetical protein
MGTKGPPEVVAGAVADVLVIIVVDEIHVPRSPEFTVA